MEFEVGCGGGGNEGIEKGLGVGEAGGGECNCWKFRGFGCGDDLVWGFGGSFLGVFVGKLMGFWLWVWNFRL